MKLSVFAIIAVLVCAPNMATATDEINNLTTLGQPYMIRWNQHCESLINSLTKAGSKLADDVKSFQTKCNMELKDTEIPTPLLEEAYNKYCQEVKDLSTLILSEVGLPWGAQPRSNLVGSINTISNTITNYVTTGRLNSIVNAHIYPKGQELKFDYSYPLNILSIFDCTLSLQEVFTNAFLHQK